MKRSLALQNPFVHIIAFWAAVFCFTQSSNAAEAVSPTNPPAGVATEHEAFFKDSVLPILEANCFKCHADKHEKGGLRLDLRSRLMTGGESGAVVDLESPDKSLLLQAVRYDGYEMPPRGKLPEAEIATLVKWVSLGAPYSSDRIGEIEQQRPEVPGADVSDQDRAFWSFQPIKDSVPPPGASHPVDAFINARLSQRSVTAVAAATARELIRRLAYDLTGLPPSEELQQAYEANPSELHYQKIVDQLLASPAHGERWGRHWLDLVRWAETNSYERDHDKQEVWRYRSYVIDSFNQDRPYNEFAAQQIAGDEMPYSDAAMIATGYYRLGIWDDEPADPEQAFYDDMDDIVTVTSQVFLGLTVNCARCHDHKIDPIRQADYYRLLAFFSGLNRFGVRDPQSIEGASLRPLVPPAQQRQRSQELGDFMHELAFLDKAIQPIERRAQAIMLPVEKEDFVHEMNRVPILGKYVGKHFTTEEVKLYEANLAARVELKRERPAAVALALVVTERGSEARPTTILVRGNPHSPGEPVVPGFVEVLGGGDAVLSPSPNPETSGRRSALAKWVVDPKAQPMTARVMANRLWQYHFGRGIVRTPSDYGFAGSPPTHPELLDFLAARLIENDWHLKPLHRLIVTSDAYKRGAKSSEPAVAVDPENDLFWRFDPRRLSAEEVRDSMLAVCGRLDTRVGGQSVYPFLEAEVLAGQSRPGAGWQDSSEADRARRSIYVFTKRSLSVPLLANFDAADTDFTCPVRFATTQPTQALGLINGGFVHQVAGWMAAEIQAGLKKTEPTALAAGLNKIEPTALAGGQNKIEPTVLAAGHVESTNEFVSAALKRTTQRHATPDEIDRGVRMINSLQTEFGQTYPQACAIFCLTALNLNEFIFLD